MSDYYNLFPNCERCKWLKEVMNSAVSPETDESSQAAYAEHLLKDHKLSRKEIAEKTGVFIC